MLNRSRHATSSTRLGIGVIVSALFLSACSSSDDDSDGITDPVAGDEVAFAFVSGQTPTFDAGQIERFSIGDEIEASGAFPATLSDIVVRTDGTNVYQVGRFNIDSITRFQQDNLTTPDYQYSVRQDAEISPNTFDIVFASETKAYILQYGGTSILIADPSATTEAEFITGSIDISAYDDDAPNAANGIIVDGQLFVLMQRLTGFTADKPGYVAVFDVETDTEIATGMGEDGLDGVLLTTVNPSTLQFVEATNEVLVVGRGNLFAADASAGDRFQGGIESIDATDFTLDLLLDDGTEESNEGFFNESLVATDTRGYIVTAAGFGDNTLRSYNPLTGVLEDGVVAGLSGVSITALGLGPAGRLWVGLGGTEPGFTLIDPETNTVVIERVATEFVPDEIVFTTGSGS